MKSSFTKVCLVAVLLMALGAIFTLFNFTGGVNRSQVRPEVKGRKNLPPIRVVNQEPARRIPIVGDRINTPSDEEDEMPGEEMTDASAPGAAEVDLSDIPGADSGELCRRLGEKIRAGESPETIAIAAELIKRGDASVPAVERLLNSGNKSVETAAMRILVRIGTAGSIGTAIPKIIVESSGDSRKNLLQVFGNVRSLAVSGIIADMMASEQKEAGRSICKEILVSMEGGEVVEALVQRIPGKDQAMPGELLDVLTSMSKPSNVAALENVLVSDDRPPVQAAVAGSLSNIGDRKACLILAEHADLNQHCRDALALVRSPYAQKTLIEIASGAMGESAKSAAIKALSHYNTPPAK